LGRTPGQGKKKRTSETHTQPTGNERIGKVLQREGEGDKPGENGWYLTSTMWDVKKGEVRGSRRKTTKKTKGEVKIRSKRAFEKKVGWEARGSGKQYQKERTKGCRGKNPLILYRGKGPEIKRSSRGGKGGKAKDCPLITETIGGY